MVISWCAFAMLMTHRYTFTRKSTKFQSSKAWLKTALATPTVGLQAIGYDSIRTRRKWCGVCRWEEQVLLISHHSPLVTQQISIKRRLWPWCATSRLELTFQLPIKSVRSFAVATTIIATSDNSIISHSGCSTWCGIRINLVSAGLLYALYLNAPMCELHQLQMLINTAARVVSGRSRIDHIIDFVKDVLHWLPITQRVHLKVCMLVYKASHGFAPTYLSDLVVKSTVITLHCDLRSSTNFSFTSSTVCRTCFCGWWSNVMEFASWRSLRCDITNTISSSTKETFVYYHVWKQLVMMVVTSAWIVIVKCCCGLVVL